MGWEVQSGREAAEKISKISIFVAVGDAVLIDFNRFGKVVSRRAGIIRLIDFPVDESGVGMDNRQLVF